MSVAKSIERANRLLPGTPAPDGKRDRRWQAIIRVSDWIESDPEPVWQFARRWGSHPQDDWRIAIASCLLEHLLEHHFALIYPRVKEACKEDLLFADTFTRCWKFGQALVVPHSEQFNRLQARCRARLNK